MAAGDLVVSDGQYEYWHPQGASVLMGAGTPIRVMETDGLLGPAPINSRAEDRGSADGALYAGREYMGKRTVQMEIMLEDWGTDVELTIDAMMAALQPGDGNGILTVQRRAKAKRRLYCRISRAMFKGNYDQWEGGGAGVLEFIAADPRLYTHDLEVDNVTGGSTTQGRTYPREYPWSYGAISQGTLLNVNNMGNTTSWPIVKFMGPCTNPIIRNARTDQEVRLNMSVPANSFVEIDMAMHSALIDGTATRRGEIDPTSEFWGILPGLNEIRYLNGGTNDDAFAVLEWRSAWVNG